MLLFLFGIIGLDSDSSPHGPLTWKSFSDSVSRMEPQRPSSVWFFMNAAAWSLMSRMNKWKSLSLSQIPQRNRSPAGQSEWKCGQNELRDFEKPDHCGFGFDWRMKQGHFCPRKNKKKNGCVYTERTNKIFMHSSSAENQKTSEENHLCTQRLQLRQMS